MTKINKTGRRWCFLIVGINNSKHLEEIFEKEKRVRYATWYIINKERAAIRGYIELRTPLKKTGVRKILGDTSIVCFASRKREEIIKDIKESQYIHEGPYNYGERELNKGGRPKKRNSIDMKNKTNNFFVLSSYIFEDS